MPQNPIGWTDQTWNPGAEILPIPGCPCYYVDKTGDIISTKGARGHAYHHMRPMTHKDGHLYVLLRVGGKQIKMFIHRAVLLAFRGEPKPGEESRHLDDNPANNRLENLVWGTRLENVEDKRRNGRLPIGERSGTHRLTEEDVRRIRTLHGTRSLRDLAREFGVSHTEIRRVALGLKWASLGGT